MDNHKEQLRQLKRLTLANYFIIASVILASGYWIGKQTHHQAAAGLIVLIFLVAGLVCMPIVYRTSQLKLKNFKNFTRKEMRPNHTT